jgi:hypothetical protein
MNQHESWFSGLGSDYSVNRLYHGFRGPYVNLTDVGFSTLDIGIPPITALKIQHIRVAIGKQHN